MSRAEDELAFHIQAVGLPEPQREFGFQHARRWRADFAWPEQKVLCEVEGGVWTRGRHVRGAGFEADMEKYNAATLGGWRLIRVTPAMVRDGRAIRYLEMVLL